MTGSINPDEGDAFAEDWIAAWNAHDLDRVLSHYADDIVFLSPIAQKLLGDGRVEGFAALRSYWSGALAQRADLKFELFDVLIGHACLTILYRNHRGQKGRRDVRVRPGWQSGPFVRMLRVRTRKP